MFRSSGQNNCEFCAFLWLFPFWWVKLTSKKRRGYADEDHSYVFDVPCRSGGILYTSGGPATGHIYQGHGADPPAALSELSPSSHDCARVVVDLLTETA